VHCLKDCIVSLANQTVPRSDYEVFLVNAEGDSSIDSLVKTFTEDSLKDFNFHYFRINRGGRAEARNYGIKHAQARVLLFYASDFLAPPQFLECHIKFHGQNPDSRLVGIGPAFFSATHEVTPFMRWLEESGALFGVPLSATTSKIPGEFFYGGNTSIKADFLNEAGVFDEQLPHHCVEDFELGHRLFKRGMKTVFLREAFVYHDHHITIQERRTAMEEAGESTAILALKNPDFMAHVGYSVACKRPASMIRLVAAWYRIKYFLFRRDEDLSKYFELSMTQAWVKGYRRYKKTNRTDHPISVRPTQTNATQ